MHTVLKLLLIYPNELYNHQLIINSGCCSVAMSGLTLRPHGLQHTRLPCPSPSPGACSNSCPLSWWCHPTISSSVVPFSSCPQSFPAIESFLMSQFNKIKNANSFLLQHNSETLFPQQFQS